MKYVKHSSPHQYHLLQDELSEFLCGKQSLADQKIKIGVQANKKFWKIKKILQIV